MVYLFPVVCLEQNKFSMKGNCTSHRSTSYEKSAVFKPNQRKPARKTTVCVVLCTSKKHVCVCKVFVICDVCNRGFLGLSWEIFEPPQQTHTFKRTHEYIVRTVTWPISAHGKKMSSHFLYRRWVQISRWDKIWHIFGALSASRQYKSWLSASPKVNTYFYWPCGIVMELPF